MSSTFADAVAAQEARTANGMSAFRNTENACLDLFYAIGASRHQDIIPKFVAAYVEDSELALRIAQWGRDILQGAGERQVFRSILVYLEHNDPQSALKLLPKIPQIGRWDDLLVFTTPALQAAAFAFIQQALAEKNGLCAKWMPRKGAMAEALRAHLGYSPKRYRKTLVTLTQVVETQMCAQEWDSIEFSKVPSLAAARYRKAFLHHAPEAYASYAEQLTQKTATIHAKTVFPIDVLKGHIHTSIGSHTPTPLTPTEKAVILAQWDALENFIQDAAILPMVDVSGSMHARIGRTLTCMEVAISIGLYCADKNTGAFKDTFLTFTDHPELVTLKGDVLQKIQQMSSHVGYNTNLEAAIYKILEVAQKAKVAADHMPRTLLILSDMQFDTCMNLSDTALDMIHRLYEASGYKVPNIVFWNIAAHKNTPIHRNQSQVALVSGFSTHILKTILSDTLTDPISVMLDTVKIPRYDL